MNTFSIDGRQYRVRPFEPDDHIMLMLKLAPMFTALLAVAPEVASIREANDGKLSPLVLGQMGGPMLPVARELAALDRQGDARIIIDTCMMAADQIAEDGKAYPVRSKAGSISNMLNKAYHVKLKITANVVRINFADMLSGMGLDVEGMMGGEPGGDV